MMQYREQILAYAIQYKGDWYKMREAIKENKAWNLPACSCTYVTIVDPTYPCKFRRLQCPPWILFYEGNLALCEQRSVAVIGSRQPTAYGSKMCAQITKILALRYCIVSGLAKGIDGIAHREALAQHTIGIMGCGLDVYYPKVNADIQQIMAKKQLVLSEYPPHTPPKPTIDTMSISGYGFLNRPQKKILWDLNSPFCLRNFHAIFLIHRFPNMEYRSIVGQLLDLLAVLVQNLR